MLTLFLMLLSPPTSPSPRAEDPKAMEKLEIDKEIIGLMNEIQKLNRLEAESNRLKGPDALNIKEARSACEGAINALRHIKQSKK